MKGLILLITILFAGCGSAPPILMPTADGPSASGSEVIRVFVKPINTKGFGSEDKRKWGIDLSAHFTAFEVRVMNNTRKEILFEPLHTFLIDDQNRKHPSLDRAESVRYYTEGDQKTLFALIPKSEWQLGRDTDIIQNGVITGGVIQPGSQRKGLLLFKKMSAEHCQKVVLTLNGITVIKTREEKRFTFPLSCKEEN
ncbi:MAG: hypothetical protein ABGX83_00585 [Nitrospira sp.]|nr:hypothetical protein [Candidatus Manganitrophaceae bacterium]